MIKPYAELMNMEREFTCRWDERDVMTYALALGLPTDPLDERQLVYVYEKNLQVLPTFLSTVVLGHTPIAHAGINYATVLHGEQDVILHKPFPVRGEAVVRSRMTGVWDKGAAKGSVFEDLSELYLPGEDAPFATIRNVAFGRSESGFGAPTEGQPASRTMPGRAPDRSVMVPTLRQQALLYRQTGDLNPLHVDPAAARAVGFREPILHGLCTYGICQRTVLGEYGDFAPGSLRRVAVRFAGIVYPGETLRLDLWQDGREIAFEAWAVERESKVIGNGLAVLA